MEANDKFKRFLEMTDHPERFSDEELMQLARDPELAAWYKTLCDTEAAAKTTKKELPAVSQWGTKLRHFVSSYQRIWIGTAAAAVLVAVLRIVNPPSALTGSEGEIAFADGSTPHSENVIEPAQLAQTDHPSDSKELKKVHSATSHHSQVKKLAVAKKKNERVTLLPNPIQPAITSDPIEGAILPTEQDEEGLLIPVDKQALAGIYLAEMALQVAYEQQAVQKRVRAYAASLMNDEAEDEQPIIAF